MNIGRMVMDIREVLTKLSHISYQKGAGLTKENVTVAQEQATQDIERIATQRAIDEIKQRIAILNLPRQAKVTEINQNPSIAWDNGHNCAVNTILRGLKDRINELEQSLGN